MASKIDPNFEQRFFEKTLFLLWKTWILKVLGIEVGNQNPSTIDQKSISTWEGLLASILHGFWWIVEAKLSQVGTKIHLKSILRGIQKQMLKSSPLEGLLDASWPPLGPILAS